MSRAAQVGGVLLAIMAVATLFAFAALVALEPSWRVETQLRDVVVDAGVCDWQRAVATWPDGFTASVYMCRRSTGIEVVP